MYYNFNNQVTIGGKYLLTAFVCSNNNNVLVCICARSVMFNLIYILSFFSYSSSDNTALDAVHQGSKLALV